MTNLKYASSSTQRSRLLRGGETYHFAPSTLLAKPRSTRVTMCKLSLSISITYFSPRSSPDLTGWGIWL